MDLLSEPPLIVAVLELIVGLYLLTRAADVFVDSAASLAGHLRVSPVAIGALVIGFGTSLPEMLVSGIAATDGNLDLGVGNVVGSNVANLTLVLGAAALIVPLLVTRAVLVREAPLSLMAVLLFGFFARNGLDRWEGLVLLTALALVLGWITFGGRETVVDAVDLAPGESLARLLGVTVLGLAGTLGGAQLLVWGALAIADAANVSGGLIGFTLVAIGTSLPELVTAITAARRGETELILGNLLGSNIFNSLAVGGVIAVLGSGPIADDALTTFGIAGMVLVAFLAWGFMVTNRRVHRVEAVILIVVWIGSAVLMASEGVTLAASLLDRLLA